MDVMPVGGYYPGYGVRTPFSPDHWYAEVVCLTEDGQRLEQPTWRYYTLRP